MPSVPAMATLTRPAMATPFPIDPDDDTDVTELCPMTAAIAAATQGSDRRAELRPLQSIRPGTIVGHYRVLELVANGGMGVVYRGTHVHLGREVALKFLHHHLLDDRWAVSRFFAEAIAASCISHPGAVNVFDYGPFEGGAYLAMEYLRGETLNSLLKREGRLPLARIHDIGTQLACTLAAAHEMGVIHRDLKPDNVFLVRDPAGSGRDLVKVLDFGVAKLVRAPGVPLTQRGDLLGTPSYMAPEQSVHAGTVDHRCDIYSLGCLLYRLATGVVPFRGSMLRVLLAHQTEAPQPPRSLDPSIPSGLETLILRMLSKMPTERPNSMADVAHELSVFEAPAAASQPAAPTSSWRGIALVVALAVGLGLGHLATLL
jgi:serine/threonine protein kinase